MQRRKQYPRGQVMSLTRSKSRQLAGGLRKADPEIQGISSALIRAADRPPAHDRALWEFELSGMPEALLGDGSRASEAERALHVALCCCAVQLQSKAVLYAPYGSEKGLLAGCAQIRRTEKAIERRAARLMGVASFDALAVHARGLASLLASRGVAVDWALFAGQIYSWQLPWKRAGTVREWSLEYGTR